METKVLIPDIGLDGRDGRIAVLTTEHSASSYNMPVLVIDGTAYDPDDYYGHWGQLSRRKMYPCDDNGERVKINKDIAAQISLAGWWLNND